MKLINPADIGEMLGQRYRKVKPNKFSTMLKKYSSEKDGFFGGFEKAAGVISPGNLKALADTAKRTKTVRKPPGTVDLGQWWKQPLNTGPKWKEGLQKA